MPTVLLSATGIDVGQTLFAPREQLERQIQGQRRLYADYAGASALREVRFVPGSSHSSLPFDAPDQVARAIRDVVDRITHR